MCKRSFATLLLTFFIACSFQKVQQPVPRDFVWLKGTWQIAGKNQSYEVWHVMNDSTFTGSSYTIKGKDTVQDETITLRQSGKHIYYIPIVRNQNNGEAVSFKLISVQLNKLVFENPQHDFPQQIIYQLISKDSILAEISGNSKGQHKAIQFPMRRVGI